MSGHSHWARIKRKKGVTDARRGRLWSKLSRSIIAAARGGGADPKDNLSLRYAIDKAREANMPRDTIENAIKKGAGGAEGANFETVYYEGYGAGGVAILAEALTDNRHRTAPEVKRIFEKNGGAAGAPGCVMWMFSAKGQITVPVSAADEDRIAEIALEAGADDYSRSDDFWEITCEPMTFEPIREALTKAKIPVQSAELVRIPANTVPVDADNGRKVLKLIEDFEENDDIQNVYSNFEMSDEVMATLQGG